MCIKTWRRKSPTKFGLTLLNIHTPREEALHSITVEVAAASDSVGVKGVKGADSKVKVAHREDTGSGSTVGVAATGGDNADGAGDIANAGDVGVAATGVTLASSIGIGFVIIVAAVVAAVSEMRVLWDATDVRGNGLGTVKDKGVC